MKINLGCGPHALPGWMNYDIDSYPGVIRLDLSRGKLPHKDSSVEFIYSEHFFEHVTKNRAVELFKECHRVLSPEGVLRLSTPDLSLLMRNYRSWSEGEPMTPLPAIWKPTSPCDMVNEGMRMWGHEYLWDKSELLYCLMESGFESVWDCQWGKSIHEPFIEIEKRPYHGEIIFEARKESPQLY